MSPQRPRRRFLDLQPVDLEAVAPTRSKLFLGRLDDAGLRAELARSGILERLAARGYDHVQLRTGLEAGEHRLRLFAPGLAAPLLDLRLAEASILLKEPRLLRVGLELLSILSLHWLTLQDPRAAFRAERPRLPGQDHPGLGLGRAVFELLMRWADEWAKDGLVAVPEYFHNAIFYARVFRFASPVRQGRFDALRRDLAALEPAQASWAVHEGRVTGPPGQAYRWEPAEMLAPLGPSLRHYLDSAEYRRAAEAEREAARFRLVESR